MSPADQTILDALLAAVINAPEGVPRVQSFYDPRRPSWLARSDPFVLHFAFEMDANEVFFLNLFRRR